MSFTAPTKKPIIKPKVETKYEFRTSGKRKLSLLKQIKIHLWVNLFLVHIIYQLRKLQKRYIQWHLNFDFRESHSETVDVAEDYDQSFINIKFKGANKLSDKSEKFKSMTVHSLILILKNLVLIQNKRYNDFCNW